MPAATLAELRSRGGGGDPVLELLTVCYALDPARVDRLVTLLVRDFDRGTVRALDLFLAAALDDLLVDHAA